MISRWCVVIFMVGSLECAHGVSSPADRRPGMVTWAQDKNFVFVSVRAPTVESQKVKLTATSFSVWLKLEDKRESTTDVTLLKSINVTGSSHKIIAGKSVEIKLLKLKKHGLYWTRLQKQKVRPKNIAIDWTRWNEDLEEELEEGEKTTSHEAGSTINMDKPPPGAKPPPQLSQEEMKKQANEHAQKNKRFKERFPDFPEHFNLAAAGLTDAENDIVAKALADDPDKHAMTAAELKGNENGELNIPKMNVPTFDGTAEEFQDRIREGRIPEGFGPVPDGMGRQDHNEEDVGEDVDEEPKDDENHIEL